MKRRRHQQVNAKNVIHAILSIAATGILSAIRKTPLGIMAVGGMVFLKVEALPASLYFAIPALAYMILIFGIGITACFNRSRFFFILLSLFLCQLGMNTFLPRHIDENVAAQVFYSVISVLLPFTILFFSLIGERGIVTGWGQRNFILILLQMNFLLLLLVSGDEMVINAMSGDFINFSFMPYTPISDLGVLAFIAAALVLLTKRRRNTIYSKITNAGIVVVVFFAHHFHNIEIATPYFYGIAGLSIVVAMIQDYYSKAYSDELTGLPARRSLNEEMMKLDGSYVIAMVDIDFFKNFNDTYGHDAGDDVLRLIAHTMKNYKKGKFFRYGGEEFTILFPGKRLEEVIPYLEEVRQNIAQCKFALRSKEHKGKITGKKVNITVSIGAAEPTDTAAVPAEVMKAADTALYRAKEQGRNCIST